MRVIHAHALIGHVQKPMSRENRTRQLLGRGTIQFHRFVDLMAADDARGFEHVSAWTGGDAFQGRTIGAGAGDEIAWQARVLTTRALSVGRDIA